MRNWLLKIKEPVNLSNWWNFWLFGCNVQEEIGFQKPQHFWVKKHYWADTIFVKFWAFKPAAPQMYSTPIRFKFLGTINCAIRMSILRTDIFVAPSEPVSLLLMRQLIVNINSLVGQRSHFKITLLLHWLTSGIFETTYCQHWPAMEMSMRWITV